jgi:nucleoside-diphosphate kinase
VILEDSSGQTNTLRAELRSKSKMAEQTLFIVKPDGIQRKLMGEIISRFEKKGFNVVKLKMFTFTQSMAEEFYSVHKSKPFFEELVSFITSDRVVAAVIEGNNAIATTRLMIGSTKSFEAVPGTIRGDFGLGISDNIIHASDSKESFDKEVAVVFK